MMVPRLGVLAVAVAGGIVASLGADARAGERFSLVILEAPMDAAVAIVEAPGKGLAPLAPMTEPVHVPTAAERLEAIFSDETLRSGDVVMFPSGPRVFVDPRAAPPWRAEDFVPVGDSRLSRRAKRAVLAATAGTPPEADPPRTLTAAAERAETR
jgi:hypothetical protein